MDCNDFRLILGKWMCNLLPDFPQDRITQMYNCLNNNPYQYNIPKGNFIYKQLNYGLYPLIFKGGSKLNKIKEVNVCYNAT